MSNVDFGLLLVTIAFATLTVLSALLFVTSRDRIKWFLFLLAILVMSMTNTPSIIYYLLTGNTEFFRFPPDRILKGAAINLVFLAFWALSYWQVARRTPSMQTGPFFRIERPVLYLMLAATGAAFAYRYAKGFEYGSSNALYGSNPAEAGAFGLIGGTAGLFAPLAALLLLARNRVIRMRGSVEGQWAIHPALGWAIIGTAMVMGLTRDMQRGDVVAPLFLGALVLLDQGHVKKVFSAFAVAFALLMVISPVLDYMRSPALGEKDLTRIAEAVDYQSVRLGTLWSPERVLMEPARKSIVVVTAAALSRYSDREGFVGIRPYIGIPLEPIPRAIWPDKPIARSINDRKDGQAMAIAGRESGVQAVLWVSGGATMYWEFWWIGVVVGGLVVGGMMAWLYSRAFATGNVFLLLILLYHLNWGRTLTEGLDDVLLRLVVGFKLVALYLMLNILLRTFRELGEERARRRPAVAVLAPSSVQ